MRDMRWLRAWAPELLPIVIAIGVPLAGVILALQATVTGDRQQGLRIFAACVLGVCVWAIVLTA
jgi:threonine/homoserine/homoserine lactone efflux protein